MLVKRILTAIVLLAVLAAALVAVNPWPLVVLLSVAAACALWEWLRLTWPVRNSRGPAAVAWVVFAILLFLASQWLSDAASLEVLEAFGALGDWLVPAVSIAWILGATALVFQGRAEAPAASVWLSLFGILAVVAAWVALVQMYLALGPWFLVSLMALIWCADIAAYFVGKAFGRRKLAPRVSPGKSWEGALGGVVAATLWVLVSTRWPDSFGAVLADRWPIWAVALIAALLAAVSIVGDLFESLLKRRAGVKDSSQLLPGHGGVYDRIDALLPVAPIALLLSGVALQ